MQKIDKLEYPLVSIIILNWNGGVEYCIGAVKSAIEQDYPNKEIIFVDNASTDGSYEAVQELFEEITCVQTGGNFGCAGGRNIGVDAASGELIFFLENDGVWPTNDIVSGIANIFLQNPEIAALGLSVVLPEEDISNDDKNLYLAAYFPGGASVHRRALFNEVGGFPYDFFIYYEESYMSYILYDMGYVVVKCPEYSLIHYTSAYSGKSRILILNTKVNILKTIIRVFPAYIWPLIFLYKSILCCRDLLKESEPGLIYEMFKAVFFDKNKSIPVKRISWETLMKVREIRRNKMKFKRAETRDNI